MNIAYASIVASLFFALSASGPVWASDDAPLPSAASEMTQEEYAAYRARIREQLEAAPQAESKDEEQATTRRRSNNGYGQGYRARQDRARDTGGMGRASGRGR
ncbi:MAG: hypothetical protein KJ850_11590 [Gammaproteobacteria bacterium]|nr:hypothetical protein [Gammaproteobacteria bacterium]MBU1625673.1 hypothetical protein [Gammaproteobacteria bacterium]MBU1980933.1 hypothetical protein [Gammaproteobacteria bacterium]